MENTTTDREIIITRHMKAPQAMVWKACTEPEHIDRWWGPDGFTNRTIRMDFRVGGEWEYTMTGPDGKVWPNLITYREIEPTTRLFYDHGDPANPKQFEGALQFEVKDGGTQVTLRVVFPSKEMRDQAVEQVGAIEGGKQTLVHLEQYLDQGLYGPEISRSDLNSKRRLMTHPAIFNFNVQKEYSTITVERSFNAPVDIVWNAWTDPAILCQWWAPRPYQCVIKSHDFREGGQWLYCMEGPEGDRHWGVFDFETIRPKTFYSGYDAFSDDEGMADITKPKMYWENKFTEEEGRTVVKILIRCASSEDLEGIIKMGFKEGFTQGLQQLEDLLNSK